MKSEPTGYQSCDTGNDEIGEYNFTLQKTNAPVNPVVVNYNDSVISQVDIISDLDAFTFEATAGDLSYPSTERSRTARWRISTLSSLMAH